MSKKALCIGINDYPGTQNDLSGCVNDANDWAATLTARGFTVSKLIDAQATKAAMVAGIGGLVSGAAKGDTVVITYSGHGTWVPDSNGDEPDGRDEGLCPWDIGSGKVLLDVSNPLDFSHGMPPTLSVVNTDSLGEQIQRAYPETKVVKTLNTLSSKLMVNPGAVGGGDHNLFISGNDAAAKVQVLDVLAQFGWDRAKVIDLGDISTARGTEQLLPIWIRLWGALGTDAFNFKIVR